MNAGFLWRILSAKGDLSYGKEVPAWLAVRKVFRYRCRYLRSWEHYQCVSPETDMTRSFEKTQIRRRLKDLLLSEQAKQGDRVLKAAAELLERRKRFADRDNYIMAQG